MSTPDLSERLVDSLNKTFGVHPGHRAAHAKGVLCAAQFSPTPAAAALCRAGHLAGGPWPAHVRFSNGSGNPHAPDGARDGRGIAIKIYGPGGTTDIIALSLPCFFTRTPEDLLEFNEARRADPATGAPDPDKVGAYLAAHPEALPAVMAAVNHPIPASYASLRYHGIHAFGFQAGAPSAPVRFGRYRIEAVPGPGTGESDVLTDDDAAGRTPDFLRAELEARFAAGPLQMAVDVVLGEPGDATDDPTAAWPDDRDAARIAHVAITGFADDRDRDGDVLVFDPTRLADGISLSDDPILLARPGAYAVSVARRSAPA